MSAEIELTIPRTHSANLGKALSIARTFDVLTEASPKRQFYRLRARAKELCARHGDLEQLYELTRGWKGTQLRINGRLGDMAALRTVLVVFQCADRRSSAVVPDDFCEPEHDHGWGCSRLNTIQEGLPRSWYELNGATRYWYQFGGFNEDRSVWTVDKKRLLEAIRREASLKHVDMCPFFNLATVKRRVSALPGAIELGDASSWDILYEEKCDNSTIQKLPVGIKPKNLEDNRSVGASVSLVLQADHKEEEREKRNIPEVSFADIGGVDDIIGKVREVIELPLKHPALFKHLGISPHKGILLYGPPGCGKTLIAKAIANEIKAHFLSIRGPELFSKWFGQSEENLRNLFSEARKFAPSVIFFDEIDAIAQKRSGEESIRHESIFVNQLLTLMDGMETYENVCVIASTNRPDLLDEAIMRPGRFDYTLEITRPGPEGCKKIFQIHTRNMPLASSVDVDTLVKKMSGFNGAEIAFVAREGAYNCLRRSADAGILITQDESEIDCRSFQVEHWDFERALKTILTSRERNTR